MSVNSNVIYNAVINDVKISQMGCPETLLTNDIAPYKARGAWPNSYGYVWAKEDCGAIQLNQKTVEGISKAVSEYLGGKEYDICIQTGKWSEECITTQDADTTTLQIDYTPILRSGGTSFMELRLNTNSDPAPADAKPHFMRMRIDSESVYTAPDNHSLLRDINDNKNSGSPEGLQATESSPQKPTPDLNSQTPDGNNVGMDFDAADVFGVGTAVCAYSTIKSAKETHRLFQEYEKKKQDANGPKKSDLRSENVEQAYRALLKSGAKTLMFATGVGLCGAGAHFYSK